MTLMAYIGYYFMLSEFAILQAEQMFGLRILLCLLVFLPAGCEPTLHIRLDIHPWGANGAWVPRDGDFGSLVNKPWCLGVA